MPPVELLADDFIENLNKHAAGNPEAKASEMEHAIRKHCTVHHDGDPAFYKSLSEKVENLIDRYQDQWNLLAIELEKLKAEAVEGRKTGEDGMSREATTFSFMPILPMRLLRMVLSPLRPGSKCAL